MRNIIRVGRSSEEGSDDRPRRLRRYLLPLQILLLLGLPIAARAQETIDRTPGMSAGWVAYPGLFHANLPNRFTDAPGDDRGIVSLPTFELGLGLPWHALAGLRFAPQSSTVAGHPDEWEPFARYAPLSEELGGDITLAGTLGFNTASESVDGEVTLARWFGPVRAIGAVRAFSSPYAGEDAKFAVGAGAVFQPFPGRAPIALAGDITSLTDRERGQDLAWSGALQVGIPYTTHTLSLFVTNTRSSTLEGLSVGDDRVRYGFELTVPIPAGRFLGWYVPREEAMEAVEGGAAASGTMVEAAISRYLFFPLQIEIATGTTIEWTNTDSVVHTVSADEGAWDSGAIQPGESWRATFTRPGRYPFHCGPHPFMKGVVIVSDPASSRGR